MDIPSWVQAGLGVLVVSGGVSGLYATMKSNDNLVMYQVGQLDNRVARAEEYEEGLTSDLKEFELRLTKQESTMEYLAIGQSRLAKEIGELTKAVLKMNEILIKQGAELGEG